MGPDEEGRGWGKDGERGEGKEEEGCGAISHGSGRVGVARTGKMGVVPPAYWIVRTEARQPLNQSATQPVSQSEPFVKVIYTDKYLFFLLFFSVQSLLCSVIPINA